MNIVPALFIALVSAIAIYTSGVVVSRSGRPINMRTYRIGNIVIPVIFFLLVLFIAN